MSAVTMIRGGVIVVLLSIVTTHASFWGAYSFLGTRSQGVDAARELVGWQPFINKWDEVGFYGAASLTAQFDHSFGNQNIIYNLFGCNSLVFSGSRVQSRGQQDILADYFGLPTDFKSSVFFDPVIQNFLIDANWYLGYGDWYFRIHSPLVYSKWDLHLNECVEKLGMQFYPAGYMSAARLERGRLVKDVKVAFRRDATFGDLQEPLYFGRIECAQTRTQLADIEMALGYLFCNHEAYHVGLNLRLVAPTGNASQARFLFEPMVGNGKHWGLGFGASAHYTFYQADLEDKDWAFYIDFNLTHLFASTQVRSYDFVNNGAGSRYMLLEKFGPRVDLVLGGADDAQGMLATNQYARLLVPAINRTSLCSKIRINIQADLVFKLSYQDYFWNWDIGYNLWARSREILVQRNCFESNQWAVKGDGQIYGFDDQESAHSLNVSQSKATLHAGQGNSNINLRNLNADSPIVPVFVPDANNPGMFDDLLNITAADAQDIEPSIVIDQVAGSNPPILLQDSDINECSGVSPRAISHKLFTNFCYQWTDSSWHVPFLGVGAEVEFGGSQLSNNHAISKWGLWLKGGIAY